MKLKRILAGVLASAMTVSAGAVPEIISPAVQTVLTASAETETYGDFEYKVDDDNNIQITGYKNTEAEEITIPSEINGMSVNCIGWKVFVAFENLKSVKIPDSVIRIEPYAFRSCSSLKSITIPDSVIYMGDNAFENCTALESVKLSDSMKSTGANVFMGCGKLTDVTMGKSLTDIELHAFSSCSSLKSITIPDSVTKIGTGAFSFCGNLANITIPDSVTSMGNCFREANFFQI